MPLSKSKVDRLGDRLRKSREPSAPDLALLQEYIAEHVVAEQLVVERLRTGVPDRYGAALADGLAERGAPLPESAMAELRSRRSEELLLLQPTSRVKTLDTTIEKLRRERTRLSTIHDIAGARVVVDGGWVAQDALVLGITELFTGAEVKDRRDQPSSGYRAVHVIAPVEGRYVEIQVRTRLQDLWAQLFERLADDLGRQIRYGHPPDDPDQPLVTGPVVTRAQLVEEVVRLADLVADTERMTASGRILEEWGRMFDAVQSRGDVAPIVDDEVQVLMDRLTALNQRLHRHHEEAEDLLRNILGQWLPSRRR